MAPLDAQWPDEEYLAAHFDADHLDTNTSDIDEYDQSARYAIANGRRFAFWHPKARETRVGYYDEDTGLLTIFDLDEVTITTHFRPDQPDYVWTLPRSTYR